MSVQSEIRQQNRRDRCQSKTSNSDNFRTSKCFTVAQPFFAEGMLEPVANKPNTFRITSNVLLPNHQQLRVDVDFMANIRDIVASTSASASSAVQQRIVSPSVASPSTTSSSLPYVPFLRSRSQSPRKQLKGDSKLWLDQRLTHSLTDDTLSSTSFSAKLSRSSSHTNSTIIARNGSASEQVKIGGAIPKDVTNSASKNSQDGNNMILLERHRLWRRCKDSSSVDSSITQSPDLSGDVFPKKSSDSDTFPYLIKESAVSVPGAASSSALPESSATAIKNSETFSSTTVRFESNSGNETTTDLNSDSERSSSRLKSSLERGKIDISRKPQPKYGSKKRLPPCIAKNCNLSISPSRISRKLKDKRCTGSRCPTDTKIMFSGVIDSLVFDLLDIAGQNVKKCHKDSIEPVHIRNAVMEDKDFYRLLRNVDIPIVPPDE